MSKRLHAVLSAMALSMVSASPSFALTGHTWVSANGGGSACTRILPCATFDAAYANTAAGGVISLLDGVDLGPIAIGKSITLRAEGTEGGTSSNQTGGSYIIINAGSADVVTLDGIRLNGGGISLLSGEHLHVQNCVIANQGLVNEHGIKFGPTGASMLSVTNTIISNMGAVYGGGIVVRPQASGSARVNIDRTTVNGGAFGIAADGNGSTAGINMTISNSMIGGNSQDGVIATTSAGAAPIGVTLVNSQSVNNLIGVRSLGPNVTVRLDNAAVVGNGTGLSFGSGGALLSYGNNKVDANGSNGAFSGSIATK